MGQDLATGLDSLHLAVIYNRLDIVDILVHKYEADPFIKNMEGNNSFHICARTGNNGIVCIIRKQNLNYKAYKYIVLHKYLIEIYYRYYEMSTGWSTKKKKHQ